MVLWCVSALLLRCSSVGITVPLMSAFRMALDANRQCKSFLVQTPFEFDNVCNIQLSLAIPVNPVHGADADAGSRFDTAVPESSVIRVTVTFCFNSAISRVPISSASHALVSFPARWPNAFASRAPSSTDSHALASFPARWPNSSVPRAPPSTDSHALVLFPARWPNTFAFRVPSTSASCVGIPFWPNPVAFRSPHSIGTCSPTSCTVLNGNLEALSPGSGLEYCRLSSRNCSIALVDQTPWLLSWPNWLI